MAGKFQGLGVGSSLTNAMKYNLLRLTGQAGDKETHAVLKKDIEIKDLTGDNTTDIQNLHATLKNVINHLKG